MMFNNEGYSLSDLAAVTNNEGFNGNGGAWWIIILFLFCFAGWGGNGGMFGGNSTGSGITDGYILTSDFANIERKIDGVNNGICSLGYDQLAQMNNINQNVSAQGAAVQNAITQQTIADMNNVNALTAQLTALGNQFQNCCCENKYALAEQSCQTRQAIADSTAAITLNQDANTRSILATLKEMQTQALQDKIDALAAENQTLKFTASQCAQNSYLINALSPSPVPAYTVPNPYTGGYGYGGCNCIG